MKNRILVIILAGVAVLASCQKPFEFSSPLSLSSEKVNLSAVEGSATIVVYANSSWTATLSEPVEWAQLEEASGDGLGRLFFVYQSNFGEERQVQVVITSKGVTKTVDMVQAAGE